MNRLSTADDLKGITLTSRSGNIDFQVPPELEAGMPPEERGLERDQVRLMVSHYRSGAIIHTQFRRLSEFIEPGDVIVINTSGTLNASLPASREDGSPLELHLSTHLPSGLYSVELRELGLTGSRPFYGARPGENLLLPAGGSAVLHTPHRSNLGEPDHIKGSRIRLWIASLRTPIPLHSYLERYGSPIRYKYVQDPWPNTYYQNIYVTEMGSAEMPSAGRAFTAELITRLASQGISIAPLVLHTGVASLEAQEPPYEEYYRVPAETARIINCVREAGKSVIAVGTTVVRALETVADADGLVNPGEGWTRRIITPQTGIGSVEGLITGLHEPQSTHLAILEALAGREHIRRTYSEALSQRYMWHEFGDLHLILP